MLCSFENKSRALKCKQSQYRFLCPSIHIRKVKTEYYSDYKFFTTNSDLITAQKQPQLICGFKKIEIFLKLKV